MTSVVNQSNQSSSLINTLLSSDSVVNPNIYSIQTIIPPHSLTYSKCNAVGSFSSNGQSTATINKYGIISQILLNYSKFTNATADGNTIPVNDFFDCINMVELLSSSRVISTLTNYDIMAQVSNLEASNSASVYRNAIGGRTNLARSTENKYCIPLVFGFMESDSTQLNSSFVEPLTVRITLGTVTNGGTPANFETSLRDIFLNVRYINYAEEQNAMMIAGNFSKPQLNQVVPRHYLENVITTTATANGPIIVQIDLKNTDCIQDFFVGVLNSDGIPQTITNVRFTGSGQQLIELSEKELEYSKLGSNGWSNNLPDSTDITASGLNKIVKLQMGVYGGHSLSNTISLREINAPTIYVTFTAVNASVYRTFVSEKCTSIVAISSATGRQTLALSN